MLFEISIIIPMYNAQDTILSAVSSVLNQTYKDTVEIIVVNDGSTDKSIEILNDFIQKDNIQNIRIINKENGGVSSARNFGIQMSEGNYIALLDADDEWLPEKLDKQLKIFQDNPDVSFVGSLRNQEKIQSPYKVEEEGKLIDVTFRKLMVKMAPQTSTSLFKKDILNQSGYYDEKQKYAEDGNLWLRISLVCKMVILNESLVITGGNKPDFGFSGLSSRIVKMEKGELKNIRDMFKLRAINIFGYFFYSFYSIVKFLRRAIIVQMRKI